MEATTCQNCGRLFMKQGRSPYCAACQDEDHQNFLRVRDYIRDPRNKATTIGQLVEVTGVSEVDITRYIHEGRLVVRDMEHLTVSCLRCGQPTNHGKLCFGCQQEMSRDIQTMHRHEDRNERKTYHRLD